MSDAQSDTHHFILTEMGKRINENLSLRRDKEALAALDGKAKGAANSNARFFSSVEGMFSLNAEEAVDGLYMTTQPRLHLARVIGGNDS